MLDQESHNKMKQLIIESKDIVSDDVRKILLWLLDKTASGGLSEIQLLYWDQKDTPRSRNLKTALCQSLYAMGVEDDQRHRHRECKDEKSFLTRKNNTGIPYIEGSLGMKVDTESRRRFSSEDSGFHLAMTRWSDHIESIDKWNGHTVFSLTRAWPKIKAIQLPPESQAPKSRSAPQVSAGQRRLISSTFAVSAQ